MEDTLAWLRRQRRLAKDWERLAATTETWICLAMSRLMAKRLAKQEIRLTQHPLGELARVCAGSGRLGEAVHVREALAASEQTGERSSEPELRRIEGDLAGIAGRDGALLDELR